jgi:hypothetical protein
MSLISIIFEDIKANHAEYTFGWGQYGEFKVILMKENSYINVTKLCQLGGKRFSDWKVTQLSQNLVKEFGDHISGDQLFIEIKQGGNQTITGTYVHPDLVPHVASWVSAKFAFMVSKVVNQHIEIKYGRIIEEKDDAHKQLLKLHYEESKKHELEMFEAKRRHDELLARLDGLSSENDDILDTICQVGTDVSYLQNRITVTASERNIPPADIRKVGTLALFRCGDKYVTIRAQYRYYATKRSALMRGDVPAVELIRYDNVPNPINFFNKVKEALGDSVVHEKINTFRLVDNTTELEVVNAFNTIYELPYSEAIDDVDNTSVELPSREEVQELTYAQLRKLASLMKIKNAHSLRKAPLKVCILERMA